MYTQSAKRAGTSVAGKIIIIQIKRAFVVYALRSPNDDEIREIYSEIRCATRRDCNSYCRENREKLTKSQHVYIAIYSIMCIYI